MVNFLKTLLILSLLGIIASCSSPSGSYTSLDDSISDPMMISLYKRNLEYEGIDRNPVIIVPGFLGSSLVSNEGNSVVWGEFKGREIFSVPNSSLRGISYPMEYGVPLSKIKNNAKSGKMLEKVQVRILGIPFKFNAYDDLINIMSNGGFVPSGRPLPEGKKFYTLFEFGYDWRQSIPISAAQLGEFIKEKRKYMQEQYEIHYGIKDYDVQFDIIGHSMGGLVSKYYLMYGSQELPEDGSLPEQNWVGSKYVDRLIVMGTPNSGYLDTFIEMQRGGEYQIFPPPALGTLPTYYQMLPAPYWNSVVYKDDPERPIDIFDPSVWDANKWGILAANSDETLQILLPDVKTPEERRKIAMDHLTKCLKTAKQFISAMSVQENPPDDVRLYAVLGYGIKTSRRAYIRKNDGKIDSIDYDSGDGKVLAQSVLYDTRTPANWTYFLQTPVDWDNVIILRAAHMGITRDPAFADNILFMLTNEETIRQKIELGHLKTNPAKK